MFTIFILILQLTKSNEHTVTLRAVPRIISGKYQCEVSADAPLFHTETSTSKMLVAELPAHNPVLSVYNMPPNSSKNGIAIGESLKATCVSGLSFPPVNFTWTINGNIFPVSVHNSCFSHSLYSLIWRQFEKKKSYVGQSD